MKILIFIKVFSFIISSYPCLVFGVYESFAAFTCLFLVLTAEEESVTSAPNLVSVKLDLTFTSITWKPSMADTSSTDFKSLAKYLSDLVKNIYISMLQSASNFGLFIKGHIYIYCFTSPVKLQTGYQIVALANFTKSVARVVGLTLIP